jgi:hypothetical protein
MTLDYRPSLHASRRRRLQGVTIAVLSVVLPSAAVRAAVRVCEPSVTSGPREAASEGDARRDAMANWLIAAGRYSPAHANWRLAASKSLACTPLAGGGYRCEAYGAPCVISQVPPPDGRRMEPLQPGVVPPKPGRPTTDG